MKLENLNPIIAESLKSFINKNEKQMEYTGELKKVYDQGFDCGQNGANQTNCNFGLYSTPEKTKAWENGKKDAESN